VSPGGRKVTKLLDEGFDALEEGRYEDALAAADGLEGFRHSSSFELGALALRALEREEEALERLERGVKKAPGVWLLWNLLGNQRSDAEDYEGAFAAWDSGLACEGCDAGSLRLNKAIAMGRLERGEEGLAELDRIDDSDPVFFAHVQGARAHIFGLLGRQVERIAAARDGLDLITAETHAAEAQLFAELALGLQASGGDQAEALGAAWEAVFSDRTSPLAAQAVREVEGVEEDDLVLMHLMVQGLWFKPLDKGQPKPMFFTAYTVVARDLEDALELIKRFEPEPVRASMKVEDSSTLDAPRRRLKGVHHAGTYAFFAPE
jgi:tetratricopeptide (TPR) repeat protein